MFLRLRRLRNYVPAADSTSRQTETCNPTRTLPKENRPPLPFPSAPSFRVGPTGTREERKAGASPNNNPVTKQTAAVKAKTLASGVTEILSLVLALTASRSNAFVPHPDIR